MVLTNPPFGVKGSVTYTSADGHNGPAEDLTIVRPDFWVRTANKQLNFVQHVVSCLRPGGRAAVVLPDNVLYESGSAEVVRRHLLQECDVHTLAGSLPASSMRRVCRPTSCSSSYGDRAPAAGCSSMTFVPEITSR